MDPQHFGSRLKELREQAGLSQKDLAGRAGLGQKSVSNWEQGTREPSWSNVVALAQALGVSCEDFLQEPAGRPPTGRGRPPKAVSEPATDKPKRRRGRPRKEA
jgi:transcriptional regulator with XRE-family HTH domain